MDRLSKKARSANMAAIKSKNTKPELIVFKELKKRGLKFKKHYNILGKPDVAFPEQRVAVFIDGEFWHGRNFKTWKNKLTDFWLKKISDNMRRDKKNLHLLKQNGWKIIRIWDKNLNKNTEKELNRIIKMIM
ncbi:MAG: very short patch repair endonuclease [Patescibacteria group bacterium]|jgi:DNA mismatch endonuclease (patch repair protein)